MAAVEAPSAVRTRTPSVATTARKTGTHRARALACRELTVVPVGAIV